MGGIDKWTIRDGKRSVSIEKRTDRDGIQSVSVEMRGVSMEKWSVRSDRQTVSIDQQRDRGVIQGDSAVIRIVSGVCEVGSAARRAGRQGGGSVLKPNSEVAASPGWVGTARCAVPARVQRAE